MAYSLDLRQRLVDAVERGLGTKRDIAAFFNVHESFIYKLLRQKRERGDIAPLPHGGGAHAKLTAERLETLYGLVAQTPDATNGELAQQLLQETGVSVCKSTVCRGIQKLELTLKKKRNAPAKPIR
jgi:putative transposase